MKHIKNGFTGVYFYFFFYFLPKIKHKINEGVGVEIIYVYGWIYCVYLYKAHTKHIRNV